MVLQAAPTNRHSELGDGSVFQDVDLEEKKAGPTCVQLLPRSFLFLPALANKDKKCRISTFNRCQRTLGALRHRPHLGLRSPSGRRKELSL